MHYLRQCSLKKEWDKYITKPDKVQLLERYATIVADWLQPEKHVFYSCVKASLDGMALEVLHCLRENHPDHSIFSTSAETFFYWKNNNIDDNYWDVAEGTQIMDTLQEYIFGKLKFRQSELEDWTDNLEYMCIDYVLKTKYGDSLILNIIYHSVARRLGLRCDVIHLVSTPFCIFWKPKYATQNLENIRCLTLSYEIEKFPDCLVNEVSHFTELYSEGSPLGDFLITANNETCYEIIRILEDWMFRRRLDPFWKNPYVCGIGVRKLNLRFKKGAMVIPRSEDVKFAIDAITLATPKWIDNSEIGRYFNKFEDTHYVPNKMLARLYPQDADITAAITAISEN
ncbi:f-box only protein 21-like protein [Lasius niger]|uniref:F-box only protein 21-like protein n=1 Tax=Lasius niger TaxID=67767 RepID=A0A0J7KPS5_LASNI|nr:f-box only protein 21-like protein [Lasius niger]